MKKINYNQPTSSEEIIAIIEGVVARLLHANNLVLNTATATQNSLIREEMTEQTLFLQEEIAQQCLALHKEITGHKN